MGKKSKAKKAEAKEDAETEEDPASEEALEKFGKLFEALRFSEAADSAAESLATFPASRKLAVLKEAAGECTKRFALEGVSVGDGSQTGAFGRGIFTTRAFKMGDVLFRDKPAIVAPRNLSLVGRTEEVTPDASKAAQRAFRNLDATQRRLLASFRGWAEALPKGFAKHVAEHPEDEQPLRLCRVMTLNAHECRDEPGMAGLFCLAARANHSCDPSCGLEGGKDGEVYFYALRDLEPGEEIVYSYLGGHFTLYPKESRLGQLRRVKLFECHCPRCLAPEPPLELPCCAEGCNGFAIQAQAEGETPGAWRCQKCGAEDADDSERKQQLRRMEPLFVKKIETLEGQWRTTEKDVPKYITSWEACAKSCGTALGARHPLTGRSLFFAVMGLNTGLGLADHGKTGVDVARHAEGMRHFGMALLDYLDTCVPAGARKVLLEPFAQAIVLLGSKSWQHGELLYELVRRAGRDELYKLPWLDEKNSGLLPKVIDHLPTPEPKADEEGAAKS